MVTLPAMNRAAVMLCAALALPWCGVLPGQRTDCTPEPLRAYTAAEAVSWGVTANEAAVLAGLANPAAYGLAVGGVWIYSAWRKAPCYEGVTGNGQ